MAWQIDNISQNPPPVLPPSHRKIGNTEAEWFESEPGEAVILCLGGTIEDRWLAQSLVRTDLSKCGIQQVSFAMDPQRQLFNPSDYNQLQIERTPESDYAYDQHSNDTPFHYMPAQSKLLIGPHGAFHTHMFRATPGYEDMADRYLDKSGTYNYGYSGRIKDDGELQWYNEPLDREKELAHQALASQFGDIHETPKEEYNADDWDDGPGDTWRTSGIPKQAHWNDIMAKAKRLISLGNVQILRNGFNNIVAHVIGDHGEYESEISRDDPSSRSITQWTCFLPDAPITMADGTRKPISAVVPGDLVITHKGNIRKVTNAWSKDYDGSMTQVKMRGMDEEFISTSNHPLWIANEDYHLSRLVGWRGKMRLGEGPIAPKKGWREASTLQPKDYLSFSFDCSEEDSGLDPEVAYLLGWYTAEGCIVKSNKNRVAFSLNATEWHVAEELSDICERHFGTPGTIRRAYREDYNAGWQTDFRVSSSELRALVDRLVGTGSKTKRLALELMCAPLIVQEEFLRGWWEGDGSFDKHGNRHNLHTTSPWLAYQSRVLIGRLGFDSNLSWSDDNDGNGFVKNWARIYRIRWNENRTRKDAERFIEDGSVWHRVESVTHYLYTGLVYDLEVEEDHSFQAYSVNSHNCTCPWDQYAFQRTRQWKKLEARPCAHVLATYWSSLSTPIDDYDPDQHGDLPPGQKASPALPPGGGIMSPEGFGSPTGIMNPSGQIQGMPQQALGPPYAPPAEQGVLPPNPMDPAMLQQPVSVPGGTPGPYPANPIQQGGTFSHFVQVSKANDEFPPGSSARLEEATLGQSEGREGATDAGQWMEIPQNARVEVVYQDPSTGWIEVIYPLRGGPMTSYHVRCFVEPEKLTPLSTPSPFQNPRGVR